ncbi:hypothetical protein CCL10_04310 [Pseudomonas syringae]|nr:hypothetical protein CCL10_04310 [Pseudomonas syringae]
MKNSFLLTCVGHAIIGWSYTPWCCLKKCAEGVEVAPVLTSDKLKTLFIDIQVTAENRQQELKL